jgi:DNA-binding MarR family transcriptional regulator
MPAAPFAHPSAPTLTLAANVPHKIKFPEHAAQGGASLVPPAPRSVDATGLSRLSLAELVLKVMLQHGLQHLQALALHLCLAPSVVDDVLQPLRREALVETKRRGATDGDISFELTQQGRQRAGEALARSQYTGPAPVPLSAYLVQVQLQSISSNPISAHALYDALKDVVLLESVQEQLGAALNSHKTVMLYGPPGAGKSYLCQKLGALFSGPIAIPHAIDVEGEIVRVYDPLVHHAISGGAASTSRSGGLDLRVRGDERWMVCERPVVVTGGELTLEMLDLVFDARAGYYQAPPHVKANNGMFLIDDLGRQLVTPRQLLNRWIVPMSARHDFLMLRNGNKFKLPFDTTLFFSTNLSPDQVADEAFLRRIGYKIHMGALPLRQYRTVFFDVCEELNVQADGALFDTLLVDFHQKHARPLMACYPRDLVSQAVDYATFRGKPRVLTLELIDWAWHNYFASATGPGFRAPLGVSDSVSMA